MHIKGATAALFLTVAALTGTSASAQLVFLDENGEIGPGDRRDSDSYYYDEYTFSGNVNERIRISMNNIENLDPYIILYGPSGSELARNDDANGTLDAQLVQTLPRSGSYRVVVRSFNRSNGRYRVLMENLSQSSSRPWLVADQTRSFNDSVPRITATGSHYHDYRVSLQAGQEILLRQSSSAFDAYLYVYAVSDMNNALASNDDSGGGRDSMILFRAPYTGEFIVRASQLGHGDGAYTLTARRLTPF